MDSDARAPSRGESPQPEGDVQGANSNERPPPRGLPERIAPRWARRPGRDIARDVLLHSPDVGRRTRDDIAFLIEQCLDMLSHQELRDLLASVPQHETFLVQIEQATETCPRTGWRTNWTRYNVWRERTVEYIDTVFDWDDYPPPPGFVPERSDDVDWDDAANWPEPRKRRGKRPR